MKTIPLNEAIELLAACTAVYVDDETVTFPEIFEEEERDEGVFMNIEATGSEVFKIQDNENPEVDADGRLILTNTDGEKTRLMLLFARPIEV